MSTLPLIGRGQPLGLIAGPCVIESEEHVHFLAAEIRKIAGPFVFKASFDKANRTSVTSYRGPGLKEGLRILADRARQPGLFLCSPISTSPRRPDWPRKSVDILQIPAFLCRQTDLLLEAGRTGRIVNIKKGQFVAPARYPPRRGKSRVHRQQQILLTERGSSFGYNNLVVDMRGLQIMRDFGWPVVFDATHSVQLPGGRATPPAASRSSSSARPRRRRGGRGWHLRGSARSARARPVRWRECPAIGQIGGALGEAAGDPQLSRVGAQLLCYGYVKFQWGQSHNSAKAFLFPSAQHTGS